MSERRVIGTIAHHTPSSRAMLLMDAVSVRVQTLEQADTDGAPLVDPMRMSQAFASAPVKSVDEINAEAEAQAQRFLFGEAMRRLDSTCLCSGRQNGEPYCPCEMRLRGVVQRDGRWIEPARTIPEKDLGPVGMDRAAFDRLVAR